MRKIYFLLIVFFLANVTKAQVTNYSFAQTSGTYSPITGSTIFSNGWDDNINNLAIPFSFIFNKTSYTSCSVNSNGFITFGSTQSSAAEYFPVSSSAIYSGAISALGVDLESTGSAITYSTLNTSPNRIFIIQWKDAIRYNGAVAANGNFNFQIQLFEGSNIIQVVYGNCSTTYSADIPVQVGLRGTNKTDFNNRTTVNNWPSSTAGTSNTSTCYTGTAPGELPSNGLTYTWTPPPLAVTNLSPLNACAGSPLGVTLTGNSFTGTLSVKFNGINATSFSVVNDSTITAVLPSSSPIAAPIIVATASGNASSSAFTVNPIPSGTLSATENSGTPNDNIICAGAAVKFTATSGFGSYIFKVNGNIVQTGTSNFYTSSSLLNGASVTVDAANSYNCGATFGPVVITVNPLPSVTLSADKTTICAGDKVTFTATSGNSYTFKVNGTSVQSGSSNIFSSTTLTNGASVTVDVTNSNGCIATSSSVAINVNPLPSGTLSASSTTICLGDNIDFTATNGFNSYEFKLNGTSVQGPGLSNIYNSNTLTNGSIITAIVTNASGCLATLNPVAVNVNPLPSGTLVATENSGTANDNIICAGSTVAFAASPGFSNYNFKVNGISKQNSSLNTYTNNTLANGDIVTVTVRNSNCTTIFNQINIVVNSLPTGTITASASSVCSGTNVNFTATPGYSNYNFKVNGNAVQNSSSNTYSTSSLSNGDVVIADVTNSNGCTSAFGPVTVNVNSLPAGTLILTENSGNTANDGIICSGTYVVFTAPSGYANYNFLLNGSSVQNNNLNTYSNNNLNNNDKVTVVITNSSDCISTLNTLNITVNTLPASTLSGPNPICQGSLNNVYTTENGQINYTWNVVNGTITNGGTSTDNTVTISWLSAGAKSVKVNYSDINGCSAAASATVVNDPGSSPTISGPASVCQNSTGNIYTTQPGKSDYVWTVNGGTVTSGGSSNDNMITITWNTSGTNSIQVNYSDALGCGAVSPATYNVTVNAMPTVAITNPSAVCSPATADLTTASVTSGSTPGLTYSYYTDASATTVYNTPSTASAGTYYIEGTTASGCYDIKPVTVTVNAMPRVVITNPSAVCSPATVDLTSASVTSGSTAGLTYSYYTDASATTVYNTPSSASAGTYYIKGTTASGCYDIKPVTVTVNAVPTVVVTNPSAVCSPATVNLTSSSVTSGSTAGLTYSYYTDALATLVYNTPSSASAGTYYIKGTTPSGCYDIKPVTVIINALPNATISGTTSVCQNAALPVITFTGSNGVSPYTFTYTINSGSNLTVTSSGNIATVNAPTSLTGSFTYTLISVKDASSIGCSQSQGGTAVITVNNTIAIQPLSASPATLCLGSSGNLTAASNTTLIAENFNGASTFSVVDLGGNAPASAWINRPDNYVYSGTTFISGSKFMLANSDEGAGTTNTALVSPSVNTNGYSALTLSYRTYYRQFPNDLAVVEVSVNNGASWTIVQNLTGTTTGVINNFSTQTINLNAYLNNASLIIRFRYNGYDEWYWAIDDVNLVASPPTYNYSWSASPASGAGLPSGAATPSLANSNIVITPTATGNFTYTATAANSSGCTSSSNINVTVNPVPSVSVTADYCLVPGKVHLMANASGGTVSYLWSTGETTQSIDVDVAGIYDVAVSLSTGCSATGSIAIAQELVVNGNFTNGNTGFTSDYAYKPDIAGNAELIDDSGNNAYSVTTTGQNVHNNFWGNDHTANTTGSRNFMQINGHGNTLVVWKETVAVQPNTTYYFSAWAMSMNSLTPSAQLRFSVNGTLVGTTAVLASHGQSATAPDNWIRFYGTWTSGPTTTSAVIYINDLQASAGGNDFGLDDVSFATLSTFIELESAPGTDDQTVCAKSAINPIVYSVGSTASSPTITGLPTGVSTTFNGISVTITGTPAIPGNYAYTITTTGSCNPVSATGNITVQGQTIALTSGSNTPSACANSSINIGYTLGGTAAAATASGLPSGISLSVVGNAVTVSGTSAIAGTYPFTIITSGTCSPDTASGVITIQSQSASLASGSSVQSVCINAPIVNIQYTLGGTATNASVSGLPAGVSGSLNSGVFIISGTPVVAGTFNYTVTTSGSSCTTGTASGTITVNPAATLMLTSAPGTDMQTVCNNSAIANITYTVSNATSASVTAGALPAGVTGSFNAGVFTISGTPTVTGTFNYTITTMGGCSSTSLSGTIKVQVQSVSLTSGSSVQSVCNNSSISNIVYSIGGSGSSATVSGLPAGLTYSISGSLLTISGIVADAVASYNYTVTTSGSCTIASASGTITIQPAATGGSVASVSICSGSSGTLTLTGQLGSILKWQNSTNGGTVWSDISNTTTTQNYSNVIVPVKYRVVVGNTCGNVYSSVAAVGIHNYWTGANNTDWNDAGNWSDNQIPSASCTDVYIPNTSNKPVLSGGTATIININIYSGASVTVNGTGKLQIAGVINNAGTFDAGNGKIEFNGSSAQNITAGIFFNNAVKDVVISNASSNGVTLSGALDVYSSLTYNKTNAILNTNGYLTLKSTITQTAYIGDMTNHIINGDVTVERYIATGTGSAPNHGKSWQLLAVPTSGPAYTDGQTIKAAWQEGATVTNVSSPAAGSSGNLVPGYGTMVTSNVANAATQPAPGFDAYTSPGASVKMYNPSTGGYDGATSTATPLFNKKGYFVFVRGDRSVYISAGTATPTILRSKGMLFTPQHPPLVTSIAANSFESIGNPYAAPIDMRQIDKSVGVNEFFQVWDPRLGGSYNYGAFQTFSYDGSNFRVTPGSGSYGAGGSINNYLQSGQAFFVQTSGSAGTVSFTESAKAGGAATFTTLFTRQGSGEVSGLLTDVRTASGTSQASLLRTTLYNVNTDGSIGGIVDGVLNQFGDNYSNDVDKFDARKSINTGENLSIMTVGKLLSIERRKTITSEDTIYLNLANEKALNYRFSFDAENLGNVSEGYVEDTYTNNRTQLNLNGNTIVNFTIANIPGSYAAGRFRIVFSPLKVLPVTFTSVKAYKQDKNISVEWHVENERNIQQYEIEKSTDGSSFTKIAGAKATNNNGGSAMYVTTDTKPVAGINYYRIKTIDINGAISYSTIVKVSIGDLKQYINIYPNPITDGQIHLQFRNEPAGKYKVCLLNKLGQVIIKKEIERAEGNNTEFIKWDYTLAHGMYNLEITLPDDSTKNIKVLY